MYFDFKNDFVKFSFIFLCSMIYSLLLVYSIQYFFIYKDNNYYFKSLLLIVFITLITFFNNYILFFLLNIQKKKCRCYKNNEPVNSKGFNGETLTEVNVEREKYD